MMASLVRLLKYNRSEGMRIGQLIRIVMADAREALLAEAMKMF
jgi:hypothetical protein